MKTLNKIAYVALFAFAFLFISVDASSQCTYDASQMVITPDDTSILIEPFNGQNGRFRIQWKVRDQAVCDDHSCPQGTCGDSGFVSGSSFTITGLDECTEYAFCVSEWCGPNNWSPFVWFCTETTEDCYCDESIVLDQAATIPSNMNTAAWLYSYPYDAINHTYGYRLKGSQDPYMFTPEDTGCCTLIDDLLPCAEYEYYIIVDCPDCHSCEWQAPTRPSALYCFETPGCHVPPIDTLGPIGCCDYLFIVDKSGSMSDADITEAECEIGNFIDAVQADCPDCTANFAITTFGNGTSQSDIENDFECDPHVDFGPRDPFGTNVGGGIQDADDWLNDGSLNPPGEGEDQCLHVIIYTDAPCGGYGDTFGTSITNITNSGATSVSLVSFGRAPCEGETDHITDTGGTITESTPGDCVPNFAPDGDSASSRSSLTSQEEEEKAERLLIEGGKDIVVNSDNVAVYPMPFTDVVYFDLDLEADSDVIIEIYNNVGAQVYKETSKNRTKGTNQFTIQNDLPTGSYFYKITLDNNSYSGKLSKI